MTVYEECKHRFHTDVYANGRVVFTCDDCGAEFFRCSVCGNLAHSATPQESTCDAVCEVVEKERMRL